MTASPEQSWHDLAGAGWPGVVQLAADWTDAAKGWLARLPLSQEMQVFLVIELLVLLSVAVFLRRRSRAAAARPAGERKAFGSQVAHGIAVEPPDAIWGYMAAGLAMAIVMVGGVGGWAATTELAGAVLANGTVVVDTNVKKVQHPTGGIVGEIHVRDGDRVRSGDLLIRLDETITRANLQVITRQLDELAMRQARLKAERDDAKGIESPVMLASRLGDRAVAEIVAGERTLFDSRRTARAGQRAQLKERILQLKEEIGGLTAQAEAKAKEVELIRSELAVQRDLWNKNLIALTKYTQTQREATRVDSERAHLIALTAQAKGKIAEIELQIIQIDQDMRSEVIKDLHEVQGKEAELQERKVAAEDQMKRIEIRSPQDGVVHQLAAHTVGGVVNQSEPVMLIVPEGDKLVIEARIAPQDIDHVRVGLPAFIRFTAFNQRTTPEFKAVVQRVAADLTREPQQNLAYYVARLVLSDSELTRMGSLRLVPGMPADVQIKTTERTALSYLVQPLQDQFAKAFKER